MPPYSSNENKIETLEIMPNNTKELDFIGPLEIRQLEENRVTTKIVENKKGNGEIIRENGLSYLATLLNLLKSMVGCGYLSIPLAFANGGLLTTLLLLVFFASLNGFCMSQLVKGAQYHYRRLGIDFLDYGGLATVTCANSFKCVRPYKFVAKYTINGTILLLQFGFCSTFYLFIAITLKEITDQLTPFRATILQWLMLIYIPMVLLNFIRTLRLLTFFSTIGNFFMILTLIFILQILPMENKLKRPKQMLGPFGVLFSGLSLACLVYSSIGFFGYIAYGNEVKGSITLNLPQHQVSFTLVKLAICISVLGSFLLQMYVIVDMIWNNFGHQWMKYTKEKEEPKNMRCFQIPGKIKLLCIELFLRTLTVTVCFLFAAAVPNLERIIPLIGITTGMLVSFIWPAVLDLLNFVPILLEEGKNFQAKCLIFRNLLLVFVGLFGMFAGLKTNIKEMMAY